MLLPLLLAIPGVSAPSALQAFRANGGLLKGKSYENGRIGAAERNLEILVLATRRASRVDKRFVAAWDLAARGKYSFDATDFSWADASRLRLRDGREFVAVTYGPISKIAAWDSHGNRLGVPPSFQYLSLWHTRLSFIQNTLITTSDAIRETGMAARTRVDSFTLSSTRLIHRSTISGAHTLDWGGVHSNHNGFTFRTLDEPQSFQLAAGDAALGRETSYFISHGAIRKGRVVLKYEPLRNLDRWILRAQQAEHPTPAQRVARTILPAREQLEEHELKIRKVYATVRLTTDDGSATFAMHRTNGHWTVISARYLQSRASFRNADIHIK